MRGITNRLNDTQMKLLVADCDICHIEFSSGHVQDYCATKQLYCISLSAWTEAYLEKATSLQMELDH